MRSRSPDWEMEHAEALRVVCPRCGVGVRVPCVNQCTGQGLEGPPAHVQRMELARELPAEGSEETT